MMDVSRIDTTLTADEAVEACWFAAQAARLMAEQLDAYGLPEAVATLEGFAAGAEAAWQNALDEAAE